MTWRSSVPSRKVPKMILPLTRLSTSRPTTPTSSPVAASGSRSTNRSRTATLVVVLG